MAKIELNAETKYALEGRVVTLDPQSNEYSSGVVYIEGDTIVEVQRASSPAPEGFTKAMVIKTGGTIYPGLIELHNHLAYNIIPLWQVPKAFEDRDQWRRHKDYRKKMTGPLKVLGSIDGYLQAIVRYVECKLLFSGVTASQGITLSSHAGIKKLFKGIVRNVDQTVDEDLTPAWPKIADVKKAKSLAKLLKKKDCYLLHLAEGLPERANKHFRALRISPGNWAITDSLAGIHSVGLLPGDFDTMRRFKGRMVWSPMSNLMLYGQTASVESAQDNKLIIGLGADWSASGSRNLLCELKVAKLFSDRKGGLFSDEELVRMVTTNAAEILKWKQVGSLQPGNKADLIVLRGKGSSGKQFSRLINATEQDVCFVVIDGWPRVGYKRLMKRFDVKLETVKLGTSTRHLNLKNEAANVVDVNVSFKKAQQTLKKGMARLPQLAKEVEQSDSGIYAGVAGATQPDTRWALLDDHSDRPDSCQRHHLPYEGEATGGGYWDAGAVLLSELLEPMGLDPVTITTDRNYFKRLALQNNLPEYIRTDLPVYYGKKIDLSDLEGYAKEIKASVRRNFGSIQSLAQFYSTPGYLSLSDRLTIVDQALVLLEQAYVHLPLKRARHAANPLERLRILRHRIAAAEERLSEMEFHKEMITIFNSLRDLHTTYQLPDPFQDKVAFLPFFIEEYEEDGELHYVASKTFGKSPSRTFKAGVEITHWNNIPIHRAIELNGERYAGSNPAARFARGLDSMTFRPLAVMLPPEEVMASIKYVSMQGQRRSVSMPWLVGSVYSSLVSSMKDHDGAQPQLSHGYDHLTHFTSDIKKVCFAAPAAVATERQPPARRTLVTNAKGGEGTTFPLHFIARQVEWKGKKYGYIRIFSFMTQELDAFVREFVRLLKKTPANGVVIDVRNNCGGNICAAESMLQALSTRSIRLEPAQFINTALMEDTCSMNSPSAAIDELDLSSWYRSIREIKQTGSVYSLSYPITPPSVLKKYRSDRKRKLVLIVDALCYSATDIFAAGFQDHGLGKVIGIHRNTGAGGANVWTHSVLHCVTRDVEGESRHFTRLPHGADFTVAVRRTLRVRGNAGIPLEDLGVTPDEVVPMQRDDVMHGNRKLISSACDILAKRPGVAHRTGKSRGRKNRVRK